jgi:micrococcal nuclease
MGTLLALLGIGGLLFGLANLVRPMSRFGISTRKAAGSLAGVSLAVAVLGAAVSPDAVPETVTEDERSTTTIVATVETTTSTSAAGTVTTAPDRPDPDLPEASASGDPNTSLPDLAESVTVAVITDGDTIQVVRGDGSREPVRLIGIDAPERGECWAVEATTVLEELIPVGSEIGMTSDQTNRDQFDRLLRYLWVGSMFVNEELVRQGAAISRRYPPDTAMSARLDAAQDAARAAGAGLWALDACGEAATAELSIVELRYDAEGDDNQNLNDEWVRIRNESADPVDLTDWRIRDESATNRYAFPRGFTLEPGGTVTIHSGCGDDSDTALFWCSVGSAIWNNDGDTVFLIDPSGNTHYYWSYTG